MKTSGSLALIADGMWFRFNRRPWVLYLMALKEPNAQKAIFLDPLVRQGSESREGWRVALDTIPAKSRARVRALVCDNFAGSVTIAKENGWILQLCHFHLLASMRKRLGSRHPANVPQLVMRRDGYELVREALSENDEARLKSLADRLLALANHELMPWRYGNILREFVRRLPNYRAYLNHRHLQLPRTTGSIESMGRKVRDLLRQTRSLSTPTALDKWVKTYVRTQPEIGCRPGPFSTE